MELEIDCGLLVVLAIAGIVILDVDLVVVSVHSLIARSIFTLLKYSMRSSMNLSYSYSFRAFARFW